MIGNIVCCCGSVSTTKITIISASALPVIEFSDGLLIASISYNDTLFDRLVEYTSSFVMVERPLRYADRISYVSVDNVHAAEIATEHLIQLGRRRVAHITGQMTISDAQDRFTGYKNALRKADLPFDSDLVAQGLFTYEAGYNAMKSLLPHKPDALFAAGDTTALGAMQAIYEAGLRIPDDIAIVGFDDLDVATKATPPLTTIRQPIQQKGALAAQLLIDLIDGKTKSPHQILLPTQLVIRQSCGANI